LSNILAYYYTAENSGVKSFIVQAKGLKLKTFINLPPGGLNVGAVGRWGGARRRKSLRRNRLRNDSSSAAPKSGSQHDPGGSQEPQHASHALRHQRYITFYDRKL
jgi:hypothetical protein